jgi:hypothetical protein
MRDEMVRVGGGGHEPRQLEQLKWRHSKWRGESDGKKARRFEGRAEGAAAEVDGGRERPAAASSPARGYFKPVLWLEGDGDARRGRSDLDMSWKRQHTTRLHTNLVKWGTCEEKWKERGGG